MRKSITIIIALFFALQAYGQKVDPAKLNAEIQKADKIVETDPRDFFKNVQSFIVSLNDKIVFEKYYNGFTKDSVHQIQSQTKSVVALLLGIAIDKGFIKSENELVSRYFPEEFGKDVGLKSTVTIRDLLTMSAGFEWEEMLAPDDPKNENMNMFNSGKWLAYAISRPMAKKPFTEFKYNSGCPMIVAGIIEKATHMKLEDFAVKYLFDPLGFSGYRWLKDSTGFSHAGGGLFLKPMDTIKTGMLMLNKGKWGELQVVPADWVAKATASYLATSFDTSTYGYFWWIREMKTGSGKTTKVISAEGAGGQMLYLFPEYQLIVGFAELNYSTPQVSPLFIRESILPILK